MNWKDIVIGVLFWILAVPLLMGVAETIQTAKLPWFAWQRGVKIVIQMLAFIGFAVLVWPVIKHWLVGR